LKHSWRLIIWLILIIFHISPAQNSNRQISTSYPPYLYIHDKQDSLLVRKLHYKIQPYLQRMEQFLGKPSPLTLTIVLTRSEDEYYEATRHVVPEWSQAVVFIMNIFKPFILKIDVIIAKRRHQGKIY